jgi:hypothetical protein
VNGGTDIRLSGCKLTPTVGIFGKNSLAMLEQLPEASMLT